LKDRGRGDVGLERASVGAAFLAKKTRPQGQGQLLVDAFILTRFLGANRSPLRAKTR
jgi:hypothetical protein